MGAVEPLSIVLREQDSLGPCELQPRSLGCGNGLAKGLRTVADPGLEKSESPHQTLCMVCDLQFVQNRFQRRALFRHV